AASCWTERVLSREAGGCSVAHARVAGKGKWGGATRPARRPARRWIRLAALAAVASLRPTTRHPARPTSECPCHPVALCLPRPPLPRLAVPARRFPPAPAP